MEVIQQAWMLYTEGRSLELVDSSLKSSCNSLEVLRSIYIGLLCVQERPEDRPNMPSVVQMLGNDGVLPVAKHPGFFTGIDMLKTETPIILGPTSSTMSITLLEAR